MNTGIGSPNPDYVDAQHRGFSQSDTIGGSGSYRETWIDCLKTGDQVWRPYEVTAQMAIK
jgi:hypothetical protein